jgi:hypothetical protein
MTLQDLAQQHIDRLTEAAAQARQAAHAHLAKVGELDAQANELDAQAGQWRKALEAG